MAEHHRVTDEAILGGFESLRDAIAAGFAAQERRIDAVRNELAALEHRVMRRFDDVDVRLTRLERHAGIPGA